MDIPRPDDEGSRPKHDDFPEHFVVPDDLSELSSEVAVVRAELRRARRQARLRAVVDLCRARDILQQMVFLTFNHTPVITKGSYAEPLILGASTLQKQITRRADQAYQSGRSWRPKWRVLTVFKNLAWKVTDFPVHRKRVCFRISPAI